MMDSNSIKAALVDVGDLQKANADLTRQLSKVNILWADLGRKNNDLKEQLVAAKVYNERWIERCRDFRKQDADKAEIELAEARGTINKEQAARMYAEKLLLQDPCVVKEHENLESDLAEALEEIESLKAQLSPLSSATPSYVQGLDEEIVRLRKALENIAMQHLESEFKEEEDVDGADYREAYDCIVKVARAALEASEET